MCEGASCPRPGRAWHEEGPDGVCRQNFHLQGAVSMKRLISPLAALLVGASLAATAQAASDTALDAFKGQKGTLDIAGGTAHIPVMKKAAQAIMESNPGIRITVAGGGSGVGVRKRVKGSSRSAIQAVLSRRPKSKSTGSEHFPSPLTGWPSWSTPATRFQP